MDCEICFNSYDHSFHLPHTLMPCSHTLCLQCIKSIEKSNQMLCPVDRKVFTDHKPNYALLKIIEESDCDRLISKLHQYMSKIKELNGEVDRSRKTQVESNVRILNETRDSINKKADKIIQKIQNERRKLLDETDNIENYLEKNIHEISLLETDELNKIKSNLVNYKLNEDSLRTLVQDLDRKCFELENHLGKIGEFNFGDYSFIEIDHDIYLGEMTCKHWNEEDKSSYIKIGFEIDEVLKDYKRGLEYLNRSIELNPSFSIPYSQKGYYLLKNKQYDGAMECFDKAIEINSNYANAYTGKGKVFYEQNKLYNAIECLNKAIQIDSSSYLAHYIKGLCLFKKNDLKNALDCFYVAQKIEPNRKEIQDKINETKLLI